MQHNAFSRTLAIDQKDEKGDVTKGVLDSLSVLFGTGSFDVINKKKLLVGVPCLGKSLRP